MSKIKIIALSMLAMAVVFSSCKDDDEEVIDDPLFGPSLVLSSEAIEGYFGDAKSISYTISTGNGIKSLVVTNTAGDTTLVPDLTLVEEDFDGSENEFSNSYAFTMPTGNPWTAGDSFTITFKAGHSIDGVTYTTTKTVTVTYVNPATPLATEVTTGVLNNIQGPLAGAWNLVDDVEVVTGGDATVKDMIEQTNDVDFIFSQAWAAGNTTMYVSAPGFDYDNPTAEAAAAVYAAGTPSASVTAVSVGDMFVANLRGTDDYAVIKILTVDAEAAGNDETITFSYKK